MNDTIAVLQEAFSWSASPSVKSGVRASLTFYGDQPTGDIKTNVSRKRGSIIEDDFPSLLRAVADFMEQEGMTSLDEVSDALTREVSA